MINIIKYKGITENTNDNLIEIYTRYFNAPKVKDPKKREIKSYNLKSQIFLKKENIEELEKLGYNIKFTNNHFSDYVPSFKYSEKPSTLRFENKNITCFITEFSFVCNIDEKLGWIDVTGNLNAELFFKKVYTIGDKVKFCLDSLF